MAWAGETDYQASWLGNSYPGGAHGWVQMDCKDAVVLPDGRMVSLTWYEEAHSEVAVYGPPTAGTRGRICANIGGLHGRAGLAVTADTQYIYVLLRDATVQRYRIDTYEPMGKPARIGAAHPWKWQLGAATGRGILHVSDWAAGCIRSFDCSDLREVATFPVDGPRKLTVDADGGLWVIIGGSGANCLSPGKGASVARYSPAGERTGPVITDLLTPTEIFTDHRGRIVIADSHISRNHLRIYGTDGRLEGTFGRSITGSQAGDPAPDRFDTITGAGCDAEGNYVVAWNGGPLDHADGRTQSDAQGLVVRALAPDGDLRWELFGLGFMDTAYPDPANEDVVYHRSARIRLDLSRPAGRQWTIEAWTLDRERFPEDVRHWYSHKFIYHAARLDGRLFLLGGDQYRDLFTIYRTDGNAIVPCVMYCNKNHGAYPPNKPPTEKNTSHLLWRDGSNGNPFDGSFQTGEYELVSESEIPWIRDLQMDARGDLWITPGGGIRRLRYGGLDANGVPVYSFAASDAIQRPTGVGQVIAIHYEAAADAMYLSCFTAERPFRKGVSEGIGSEIQRYDAWSTAPVLRSRMPIPSQNTGEDWTVAMAVAHPWVFAGERSPAHIRVFDADSGTQVRTFQMTAAMGGPKWPGGGLDFTQAVRAFRRSSGEIQLFCEEVSYTKTMLHRWMPPGTRPLPLREAQVVGGDGCRIVTWQVGFGGATSYRIERADGISTSFAPIAGGLLRTQYVDRLASTGGEPRYRVIPVNAAGDGAPSAPVRVAPGHATRRPPTVSITSPRDGQSWAATPGTLTLQADARACDGGSIARVEFLRGGQVVGSADRPPFELRLRNLPAGAWSCSARAIDDLGIAGEASPIRLVIGEAALPPMAAVSAPLDGCVVRSGETVRFAAEIVPGGGAAIRVRFILDGCILGEDSSTPFTWEWTAGSPRTHVLSVQAVDEAGTTGDSLPVGIEVR